MDFNETKSSINRYKRNLTLGLGLGLEENVAALKLDKKFFFFYTDRMWVVKRGATSISITSENGFVIVVGIS